MSRLSLAKRIQQRPWAPAVALAFFAFGMSLTFPFIALDDAKHIWQNPYVMNLTMENLVKFWREPYYGLYIPLIYNVWQFLSFFTQKLGLTHPITGIAAPLFHCVTLVFHLLNVYLVWHLLRGWIWNLLSQDKKPDSPHLPFLATLATLPFAIHPLQAESTAWASGLKDTFSSFFALICLTSLSSILISAPSTKRAKGADESTLWPIWISKRAYPFMLGAGILALLSKPSTVVLPILMLALILVSQKNLKRFLPILVILSVGAVWLALVTKGVQPDARLEVQLEPLKRLMVALASLGFYIFKFLIPYPLAPDYGLTPERLLENSKSGWFILLGCLLPALGFWALMKRQYSIRLAVVFILIGFAPVLGFIPFEFQNMSTVADRYYYLFPAIGFGFLLATLASKFSFQRLRQMVVVLLILWLPLTLVQASHWRTTDALFLHTAQVNPNSYLSLNNLGLQELRRGQFSAAAEYLSSALQAKPDYLAAIANLGVVYFKQQDYKKTIEHYETSLKKFPPAGPGAPATFADMHFNLGAAYMNTRQMDSAIKNLRLATQINPDHFLAHFHLGRALLALGDRDGARIELSQAYRLNPQDKNLREEIEKLKAK